MLNIPGCVGAEGFMYTEVVSAGVLVLVCHTEESSTGLSHKEKCFSKTVWDYNRHAGPIKLELLILQWQHNHQSWTTRCQFLNPDAKMPNPGKSWGVVLLYDVHKYNWCLMFPSFHNSNNKNTFILTLWFLVLQCLQLRPGAEVCLCVYGCAFTWNILPFYY